MSHPGQAVLEQSKSQARKQAYLYHPSSSHSGKVVAHALQRNELVIFVGTSPRLSYEAKTRTAQLRNVKLRSSIIKRVRQATARRTFGCEPREV